MPPCKWTRWPFALLPRPLVILLASALLTLYLLLIAQGAAVLYALDAPDQATFYSMLDLLTPGHGAAVPEQKPAVWRR